MKHCKVCSFPLLVENELTGHVGVVSSRYNFLVSSFYKHSLRSSKLTHKNWARLVLPLGHGLDRDRQITLHPKQICRYTPPPIFLFCPSTFIFDTFTMNLVQLLMKRNCNLFLKWKVLVIYFCNAYGSVQGGKKSGPFKKKSRISHINFFVTKPTE